MDLVQELKDYIPISHQEEIDRAYILTRLMDGPVIYTRESEDAHITSSAWIVSPDRKRVLMAYHNIYNSWAWLGGHADGETDLLAVARREVSEESGLSDLKDLSDTFISIEVLPVAAHIRRGKPVKEHLHLNFTYLFMGDDRVPLTVKPDENSAVGWIPMEEISLRSTEPLFTSVIYPKLCRKAEKLLYSEEEK